MRVVVTGATGNLGSALAAQPEITSIAGPPSCRLAQRRHRRAVVRFLLDATWRLRLQQLDQSWPDLLTGTPLRDTTRVRTEPTRAGGRGTMLAHRPQHPSRGRPRNQQKHHGNEKSDGVNRGALGL
jgi:hypothetical protein